jgi:hypothetical protein
MQNLTNLETFLYPSKSFCESFNETVIENFKAYFPAAN